MLNEFVYVSANITYNTYLCIHATHSARKITEISFMCQNYEKKIQKLNKKSIYINIQMKKKT